MYEKTAFIINPAAGFGKTKKQLKSITKEIKAVRPDARIEITGHPLHATSLARQALREGYKRLVVIGGDGTLNEVVNGYFDEGGSPLNDQAAIAIVPSGSGSDFVRSIPHEQGMRQSILHALEGDAKPTDVGLVCAHDAHGLLVKRYFINVSSIGLSGLVAGFMKTVNRSFGAKAAYFMATIQAILALKARTFSVTFDGEEKTIDDCSLLSFANGQFFGSGMKIAPNAKLDDGYFDVISIKNLNVMFFVTHGYRVYQGSHLELDNVDSSRHKECIINAIGAGTVYIETDGELFAELPATYSLCPKAILIVR